MKLLDEYRDPALCRRILDEIFRIATRPWVLMEICGGQTHTILRYGLDTLLPPGVELVHGPGCPVCVTPAEVIDQAIEIASRSNVIFASYGDMLRVPGSGRDLFGVRAAGGDVRIVYSPLDAVKIAADNPSREVVFFAIGFETTAPAHALAVQAARTAGLANFSLLVSHVLVPPAIRAILDSPDNRVQGLIAPGHVCAVMGCWEYDLLSAEYNVPIVIGGFEPADLLEAVRRLVYQLEYGHASTENAYGRSVQAEGNRRAQELMTEVFEVAPQAWRGLGMIEESGLRLRPAYAPFDASRKFDAPRPTASDSGVCVSADILRGLRRPAQCGAFGRECTPEHPLGAPMVSAEGACSAWYRYRREAAG